MSIKQHRVAAVATLTTGLVIVVAWGCWAAQDSDEVRSIRARLDGQWVATSVRIGDHAPLGGPSTTRVLFDGRRVVFRDLVDAPDAAGIYFVDPGPKPPRIDFKLDAGWIIGVYALEGDALTLCVNPLAMPERMGVPTRHRPDRVGPGGGHHEYVFRRATP